jgi:hypothetical protein
MNAKEAIQRAKTYVADIFGDEGVINIGLEELSFDDSSQKWDVTVGFSRQWDSLNSPFASALSTPPKYSRTYKIVEVSNTDGAVLGVKNRAVQAEGV